MSSPEQALHVILDQSICIGAGNCVRMAPGAFVFDKDRQIADVGDLSAAEFERVSLAERSCPTGAIYIE